MIIDTTATEPPRNWFLEIASAATEDLLSEATRLRAKLSLARLSGHIVDARAYELRLLDVERAIAIHNRRATETEDARSLQEHPAQREADLREAFAAGCLHVAEHARVTDCGAGPSVETPSIDECERWAAMYARSKAGG